MSSPLRCSKASSVFIAVPAYAGVIGTETAASLIETVYVLRAAGLKVASAFLSGSCYIESARNDLVGAFLESGFTDLLFVDADVGFAPETAVKLLAATRPFVAAVYPKKEPDQTLTFPVDLIAGEHTTDAEGLIEAHMVPTGCLRLNRLVFGAIEAPEYVNPVGKTTRAYFRNEFRDKFYGEDTEFCRRWREAGGKIWLYPNATLSHFGNKLWRGNVAEAMAAP